MSEPIYDETDRRLISALHNVEVPPTLQSRLERSLRVALAEQELLELPCVADKPTTVQNAESRLLNRRNVIAAGVAAGLGAIAFGYRQLTQPLSQSQLVESTRFLQDQLKQADWQALNNSEAVAIRTSLQDVGFLRQVRNVSFKRVTSLQPPRHIQLAKVYDLGSNLVLFDLTIQRGVHHLSLVLSELDWPRSDTRAFAMCLDQRTLVFAGPAGIQGHIFTTPTT